MSKIVKRLSHVQYKGIYFFATNIEPTKETNQDDFIAIRLNATKAALKNLQKR